MISAINIEDIGFAHRGSDGIAAADVIEAAASIAEINADALIGYSRCEGAW
jgi:hypothetical protein